MRAPGSPGNAAVPRSWSRGDNGLGRRLADFVTKPEPARGPAGELGGKPLSRFPPPLGRFVFLASLRDPLSGRYAHPPLSQIVGGEITDRTLCHSHHQVFSEWLSFPLAQQKVDLDEY